MKIFSPLFFIFFLLSNTASEELLFVEKDGNIYFFNGEHESPKTDYQLGNFENQVTDFISKVTSPLILNLKIFSRSSRTSALNQQRTSQPLEISKNM